MLVSTTHEIANKETLDTLGVLHSEVIVGVNVFRDIFAGIRDFFGGRSRSYEHVLARAREEVMEELQEKARNIGAHAIVGLTLDFEVIGSKGSMIMVSAYGTAVKIKG